MILRIVPSDSFLLLGLLVLFISSFLPSQSSAAHDSEETSFPFSNDYQQYQKYRAFSSFQNSDLFPLADRCENGKKEKMFQCASSVYASLKEKNPEIYARPHWNRTDSQTQKKPSCSYEINQLHASDHLSAIQLQIKQFDCRDSFTSLLGGSSFYILAEGLFQLTCTIQDNFDNTYHAICPHLPDFLQDDPEHKELLRKTDGCLLVTAILDYEHYDAFSEYGAYAGQEFPPLEHYLLNQSSFCWEGLGTDPMRSRPYRSRTPSLPAERSLTNGAWRLSADPADRHDLCRLASNWSNYRWTWQITAAANQSTSSSSSSRTSSTWPWPNPFVETGSFAACYPPSQPSDDDPRRMDLRFVGESHMRFFFDHLLASLFPAFVQSLRPKHAETYHLNYLFDLRVFATHLTDFFALLAAGLRKSPPGKGQALLLQTGAWDLSYWPARQLLENPNELPYFRSILSELIDPTAFACCWERLWWLYLDVMPYPRCRHRGGTEAGGMEESAVAACEAARNARNNYAISAANDHFEAFLAGRVRALGGQEESGAARLRLLRSRRVVLPRLLGLRYVCHNHLICAKATEVSEEGRVVSAAIQRELCDILQRQPAAPAPP